MKRRDLLKGVAALPFLTQTMLSQSKAKAKVIKPRKLKFGDTLGVIAPSSGLPLERFGKAIKNLEDLGFKIKVGKNARGKWGIFSGTDKERLEDLHWAFSDPEIDAVWCVRGGDGSPRLLPKLDYNLIRKNPKIFVGYSDITALHLAIFQNCGLVTFHGPVGTSEYSDYTKRHILNLLTNPTAKYKIELSDYNKSQKSELYQTTVITKGKCRGQLIGGNLSLLTALAGTPFGLKNMKGKILFIEDVEEQPYRIERMLTQLRHSIDLTQLAGIALGVFEDCKATENKPSPSVIEYVQDRLGDLGIPVIYGLSFGHIRDQFTLPIGVNAELDTENATLTFLETSVV